MVPVWLADFDGVLNIIGWGSPEVKQAWGDTRTFVAKSFKITVSPTMLAQIEELRAAGKVDLRWLTTWEELANEHLVAELGWPELPIAGRYQDSVKIVRKFSGDNGWWKLEFAQAVYDTGVPMIWTDDDISVSPDAMDWLRTVDRDRMLAISPVAGLTPSMIDEIGVFVKRWNDQPLT